MLKIIPRVHPPKLLANHALYALRRVQTLRQKPLPSLANSNALPQEVNSNDVDVCDLVHQRYGKQKFMSLFT